MSSSCPAAYSEIVRFAKQTPASLPQMPSSIEEAQAALDMVVPYTTEALSRAALMAVSRCGGDLRTRTRLIRCQEIPYPAPHDSSPIAESFLRKQMVPLAAEFGAHVIICVGRDRREDLLRFLSAGSVVVIASFRRRWRFWPHTPEERLAQWLRLRGLTVVLQYVCRSQGKNNA